MSRCVTPGSRHFRAFGSHHAFVSEIISNSLAGQRDHNRHGRPRAGPAPGEVERVVHGEALWPDVAVPARYTDVLDSLAQRAATVSAQ
jgi:hypothetical protein